MLGSGPFCRSLAGVLALAVGLAACADTADAGGGFGVTGGALRHGHTAPTPARTWIVLYKPGVDVDTATRDLARDYGLTERFRYHHAVRGGAFWVPDSVTARALARDARVAQIDEDRPIFAIDEAGSSADEAGTSGKPGGGGTVPPGESEPSGYKFLSAAANPNEGAGVHVAVLDTGVDLTHTDLDGALADPALWRDCVNENGTLADDANGHGSHVAGTIAAEHNGQGSLGIGKDIKVVPVKVLNRRGSGSWAGIVCGIDWVTGQAGSIRVANLSLGGTGSECKEADFLAGKCTKSSLQLAIEGSIAAGVTYAVAAGNEAINADNTVPAAYENVLTVSAYDTALGKLASFSNWGPGVDLAAPGVGIYSTYKDGGYATLNGTSMASPHVAAAAALFLATHKDATPAQVTQALLAHAKAGNTLLSGKTPPDTQEPILSIAAFDDTCDACGTSCGVSLPDGCGGTQTCGCGAGYECQDQVCQCAPSQNAASCTECGVTIDDGCGTPIYCGDCPATP